MAEKTNGLNFARLSAEHLVNLYNPEFDTIPAGPRVTAGEYQLAEAVLSLLGEVERLNDELAALKAKKRQQAVIASLIRVGDEMADKLNGLGITAFDHEWAKCKSWLEEGGEG